MPDGFLQSLLATSNATLTAEQLNSFRWKMHLNTALSIPANVLALYLIVRHSSKAMAAYRWCLFDITLSYTLFDLHVTALYEPLPLFPLPVMCTVGVARLLPPSFNTVFQMVATTMLFGVCVGALFTASLFRLLALYERTHVLRKPVVIFGLALVHLTATAPSAWSYAVAFNHEPKQELQQALGIACASTTTFIGIIVMTIQTTIWFCILTSLPIITLRKLKQVQGRISVREYKTHRTLIIALIVQVSLPSVTMTLPILLIIVSAITNLFTPAATIQIAVQLFTLHSFLNAVATICLTRSYREAVLRWLPLPKLQQVYVVPNSLTSSTNASPGQNNRPGGANAPQRHRGARNQSLPYNIRRNSCAPSSQFSSSLYASTQYDRRSSRSSRISN